MNRYYFILIILVFLLTPLMGFPQGQIEEGFPPFHIDKIYLGDKFTNFNFVDLEGKNWNNSYFLTRP
ncbi:MAG: hypothetical protein ACQETH_16770, partial [Candidatus Rifleibacteriota bacterium]